MIRTILGIDPSLKLSGWGVITVNGKTISYVASGNLPTNPKDRKDKKLAYIHTEFANLIQKYKPEVIAMEETFINKNPTSSLTLAQVRGAIMAAIGTHDVIFLEFAPNHIKKTVTGAGLADKTQVLNMIKILLNVQELKQLDQADALAVAYTALL